MALLSTRIIMTTTKPMVSQTVFSVGYRNALTCVSMQLICCHWNFENLKEFHYADYHNWYEEFDDKKDVDLFLGFELNGNTISRYKPVGISWDDSFCRNLGIWFHRSTWLNCTYWMLVAFWKDFRNHKKSMMAVLAVTLKIQTNLPMKSNFNAKIKFAMFSDGKDCFW